MSDKILICTINNRNEECWTNPNTKNIKEVWKFIEHIFKDDYIKSFFFYGDRTIYKNPKKESKQLELF